MEAPTTGWSEIAEAFISELGVTDPHEIADGVLDNLAGRGALEGMSETEIDVLHEQIQNQAKYLLA
jgi:hypothetical protein